MNISSPHCKRQRYFFSIVRLCCLSFLLSACASDSPTGPVISSIPTSSKETSADTRSTEVETFVLGQDEGIGVFANPDTLSDTDPWRLMALAKDARAPEKYDLMLSAAEQFLGSYYLANALNVLDSFGNGSNLSLNQRTNSALNSAQQITHVLLVTRHALLARRVDSAHRLFSTIPYQGGGEGIANQLRWLKLDVVLADQQKDVSRALQSRLTLDNLLESDEQVINQRHILSLIAKNQAFLTREIGSQNRYFMEWSALVDVLNNSVINSATLKDWQNRYPAHTAQLKQISDTLNVVPLYKVALLLPMTSPLGNVAEAFKSGFEAAAKQQGQVGAAMVYDIGSEAPLAPLYYQRAVNDGADFVIGPLGRSGVASMLADMKENNSPIVSTLILGEISKGLASRQNLWGLALSSEQDAVAIAERAISQGFRKALVLQKNSPWGERLSTAFQQAFIARGGSILTTQVYQTDPEKHSLAAKSMLKINASEIRHQRLQKVLGRKLKASVRRRDDADFIFIAANANDARSLIPLINFYRAHDLPVFSTASVYTDRFNKFRDQDLSGLQFPDLPWVFSSSRQKAAGAIGLSSQSIRPVAVPYNNVTLNRLYAMGYAAFELIPLLNQSPSGRMESLVTQTMDLRRAENGNLRPDAVWASFTDKGIVRTP